ncbi:hypothetical protein VTO42DRAFT_1822 [Malbranchea cinnamomea]
MDENRLFHVIYPAYIFAPVFPRIIFIDNVPLLSSRIVIGFSRLTNQIRYRFISNSIHRSILVLYLVSAVARSSFSSARDVIRRLRALALDPGGGDAPGPSRRPACTYQNIPRDICFPMRTWHAAQMCAPSPCCAWAACAGARGFMNLVHSHKASTCFMFTTTAQI